MVTFASAESPAAVLTGFTLTGGEGFYESSTYVWMCGSTDICSDTYTSYCGGGVYVNGADPTLAELSIDTNLLPAYSVTVSGLNTYYVDSHGGGICAVGSLSVFTDLDIRYNSAAEGGAVYVDPTSTISVQRTHVTGNTAMDGAGFMVDGGVATLRNVSSSWNVATADGGGMLVVDGATALTNVTFGGDSAGVGGGLYLAGSSAGTVMNTIFYGAASGEGVFVDGNSTFTGSYNDVYGNAAGEYAGITDPTGVDGNLSEDPLFAAVSDDGDPTNDDWTLGAGSPCVDTGDPDSVYDDADGTRNDQGAFGGPVSDWDN